MANFNLNKIILGGRLTAEPELRQTNSGVPVTSFSIAVSRRKPKDGTEAVTDFFNICAWRGLAQMIAQYFHKGSSICIVGEIQNNNFIGKDGAKHYSTVVNATEAYFVDSKAEQGNYTTEQQSAPQPAQYGAPAPINTNDASVYVPDAYMPQGGLEELEDDEKLPF